MELWLVRHASSTRSAVGAWGRLVDVPLAAGFERQLERTRETLTTVRDPSYFSSPLRRCLQTCEFVSGGRPIRVVEDLRAYHSGQFESVTEASVRVTHPEYPTLSFRDRFVEPRYGEESMSAQTLRVARGLLEVVKVGAASSVVVAHYSTINIIGHIGSSNWDERVYADGIFDLGEGDVLRLEIDPQAVEEGIRARWAVVR